MRYVFSTEGAVELLGEYVGVDEDCVVYKDTDGVNSLAPYDCSKIVDIDRADVIGVVDRFARALDDAKEWIVEPPGGTGMNSLVALGVEIAEYATLMGAVLDKDVALSDLYRQVRDEGRYRLTRAHAKKAEGALV